MYIDLKKYTAHPWFEIASIPQFYSGDCEYVKAIYEINPSTNDILILNECAKIGIDHRGRKRISRYRNITGVGQSLNKENTVLKIKFENNPFMVGYYYIHDVVVSENGEYLYALVGGGPPFTVLWILSIDRCIPRSVYDYFLEKASRIGYDISQITIRPYSTIIYENETSDSDKTECQPDYLTTLPRQTPPTIFQRLFGFLL
jgi:lipocalin